MKEEVFEQRIREYTPNMYRLAYGILQNHEDAQDAVGETILRAFEKIHTLRRPECFRTWLMQITANEAKKFMPEINGEFRRRIWKILCRTSAMIITSSGTW